EVVEMFGGVELRVTPGPVGPPDRQRTPADVDVTGPELSRPVRPDGGAEGARPANRCVAAREECVEGTLALREDVGLDELAPGLFVLARPDQPRRDAADGLPVDQGGTAVEDHA